MLKTTSRKFYKQHGEELCDILLFGSYARKEEHYQDIDITLITLLPKEKSLALAMEFQKLFSSSIHISSHCVQDLFSKQEPIYLSLLHEGYSLVYNRSFSATLHLSPKLIFTYTSNKLVYKDKIRFYYALKGRDGKGGILARSNSQSLSKGIILTESSFEKEFTDFFVFWKIPFTKKKVFFETH